MKYFKRFVYLAYYLYKLDKKLYRDFTRYVSSTSSISKVRLVSDSIVSVFKYNISLLEYYYFHFYNKDKAERKTYAGTGYMYEFQRLMNPPKFRSKLEDKREFNNEYKDFIIHKSYNPKEFLEDSATDRYFGDSPAKIVAKKHDGQCGIGVQVIETKDRSKQSVVREIQDVGNDLIEEYIYQHERLMALSPSGLNTVRIYTQLDHKDNVDIIGCRLRISVNSIVDNLAAGNLAAPIDTKSGKVNGPAVYSDIRKESQHHHPITNVEITGFQIPLWKETINLVKNAALHNKNCRSIGWDVAVTDIGPELLEGNHDWCKLVWQLPVNKGLKQILEEHKKAYIS